MKRPLAFIIEDQMNLSMLYEDALRLVGFDVLLIRNGLEAINAVEMNEPPTFIVLDVNLPGLSGRDVLQHIRKNQKYAHVPVMVATANSVMAKVIQPNLSEIDQLFIKPVSMLDLQKIAKDIAKKQLEMSTQELRTAFQETHDTQSMQAIKEDVGDDNLPQDTVKPDDETLPDEVKHDDETIVHRPDLTSDKPDVVQPDTSAEEETDAPQS